MGKINMNKLGFSDKFAAQAALYDNFYIGRVFSQFKDCYKVMCENGEVEAEVSGKFRYEVKKRSDFPSVGDFVMLDRNINVNGNAIIQTVLPRKSAFIRRAAGSANAEQVVASNIDIVFICMSLNNDFNLRRLERYLSVAWDSGATPILVLTKSDLSYNLQQRLCEVEVVAIGVNILVTSALQEKDYLQVMQYIKEGQTAAFIGSSGVGKSTLINAMIGEDRLNTNGLRNDDKGKHTTTRRELFQLKNGGMVIDTPGMRELGLENAAVSKTFADIDELASFCRFNDCTHSSEPGCAVQKAIIDGTLSAERLISYQKLKKEAKYDGLNARQIENMKINELFSSVGGMKNARKFAKEKNKRR